MTTRYVHSEVPLIYFWHPPIQKVLRCLVLSRTFSYLLVMVTVSRRLWRRWTWSSRRGKYRRLGQDDADSAVGAL